MFKKVSDNSPIKINMRNRLGLCNYFKINHLWIKASLIFLFFFFLFLSIHLFNGQFTLNDDSYYHAKHALLIEQSGKLNLVEPWLEFHFFNYAPVDPWWGFHLGMALFIYFFGFFPGVKIFVSLLVALMFLVFYLILSNFKIKYALAWTSLLFISSTSFNLRLLMDRPHLLAIVVFPLIIYFLIKNKNFWLFVLTLIYTLSYHLAPLAILPVILFITVGVYFNKQLDLKPLIASVGGILVGIILHPNSLNYLYVMFITSYKFIFIKIFVVNLPVSELNSLGFFEFLKLNFLGLCLYVLAIGIFLSLKKQGSNAVVSSFLFLYSGLWFIISLIMSRGIEYWLPAAILFSALVFNNFFGTEDFNRTKHWLADKINFKVISFFIGSALILIILKNLSGVFTDLRYNNNCELRANYQQVNNWLKVNTKKDSVVFYDKWDMWPMMFFYNNYNHYITGIGPNFLYDYDQQTYWLWYNISEEGLYCDQPKPCLDLSQTEQMRLVPLTIKTVFRAKYAVVLNYKDSNLIKTFNNLQAEVKLVFKNKDLLIYEMK